MDQLDHQIRVQKIIAEKAGALFKEAEHARLKKFQADRDNLNKEYEDIFFNIQQQIDEENAKLNQQTLDNISGTNAASQATSLEGIQDLPGMDTVLESRDTQSIFAASTQ